MKTYLPITLKKAFLFILVLVFSKTVKSQFQSFEFFDIIKLYSEEQYDVVISKLKSKGFTLEEYIPDYTSDGIEHKGAFFMIWPLETVGKLGIDIDWCRFRFNTDSYANYKEINIKFTMCYVSGGLFTYNDIVNRLKGQIKYWYTGSGNKSTTFIDSTKIYGKNANFPGDIFIPLNPRQNYFIKYYENNHKVAPDIYPVEVVTLEGEINLNLVKYPIENISEYLNNPVKYTNQISVPIKQQGDIHTVEINIAGINYTYIIDSGASEMLISKSTETRLLDLGVLRNSDYLPSKTFRLADGTERIFRRAKLSSARIMDLRVEDIVVAITDDNKPLLLGKSFLDKFKTWKINNA